MITMHIKHDSRYVVPSPTRSLGNKTCVSETGRAWEVVDDVSCLGNMVSGRGSDCGNRTVFLPRSSVVLAIRDEARCFFFRYCCRNCLFVCKDCWCVNMKWDDLLLANTKMFRFDTHTHTFIGFEQF